MFSGETIKNQLSSAEAQLFISPEPLENTPDWADAAEGELAVDVLETDNELVVVATMAGTRPEDIFLHLHNDFLTIRGSRSLNVEGVRHFFYEECFWGKFSRTIVLPAEVKGELARSEYRNGVLTIWLPKAAPHRNIPILVIED